MTLSKNICDIAQPNAKQSSNKWSADKIKCNVRLE